jgi:hypothetical protein
VRRTLKTAFAGGKLLHFCKAVARMASALVVSSPTAIRAAKEEVNRATTRRRIASIASIFFAASAAILCSQSSASAAGPCAHSVNLFPAYPDCIAYDHSAGPTANFSGWMASLSDVATLASLSIPGTHDSGTYGLPNYRDDIVQTQSMSIANQLYSGIRFLDIRVNYVNPAWCAVVPSTGAGLVCNTGNCSSLSSGCDLWVFHGSVFLNVNFATDVLLPVINFLKQQPTEVVIMRVAGEPGTIGTGDVNDAIQQVLSVYAATYPDMIMPHTCASPGTAGGQSWGSIGPFTLVDIGPNGRQTTTPLPNPPVRLGPPHSSNHCDARGKLVILTEYIGSFRTTFTNFYDYYSYVVGETCDTQSQGPTPNPPNTACESPVIPWNQVYPNGEALVYGGGQDSVKTNWDLYNKWGAAEVFFDWVNGYATDFYNGTFYANHLNASVGGFPYFFASGQSNPENGGPLLATGSVSVTSLSDYNSNGQEYANYNGPYPDFPRVNCAWFVSYFCTIAFEGMNQLATEYLDGNRFADNHRFDWFNTPWPGWGPTNSISSTGGIVQADFPGRDLIAAIINVNLDYLGHRLHVAR